MFIVNDEFKGRCGVDISEKEYKNIDRVTFDLWERFFL